MSEEAFREIVRVLESAIQAGVDSVGLEYYLGRSFAILPAVGAIVNGGPYRFIRHPAYLGEFTMTLACFLSNPRLGTLGSLALSIPAIVARIHTEEKLLASESSYQEYRQQVRWRLLPGLW